jgi:tRNA(fMet)-specific endonuclease VapC
LSYLLDTNACIALINGKPPTVRLRFAKAIEKGGNVFVPSTALFELWYGVFKSSRQQANAERLEAFLAGPVTLLPFAGLDAQAAGRLRATLETAGRPIGAYDLLIAGQAIQHNLTLVTANLKEFGRVQGLTWEDWAKQ